MTSWTWRVALCLLALLWAAPLRAQPPATPPAAAPELTQAQARQAVELLNDPKRRAALIAVLEAIARTQPAPKPTAAPAGTPHANPAPAQPATPGVLLAPNSVGAAVLVGVSQFMSRAADRVSAAVRAASGLPSLWAWLVTMATNPLARALLVNIAWRLAVALAVGGAAQWAAGRALRRPLRLVMRRLAYRPLSLAPAPEPESGEARAEQGETEAPGNHRARLAPLLRRVPLVLARIALELVPVLAFLAAGHVAVATPLGGSPLVRLIQLAAIDSVASCVVALRLARALLAPRHPRLRLLPVSTAAARYTMRWLRRLLVVGVFGYAIGEVGLLLGLSEEADLAVLKGTVLVLHLFLGIIVMQKRRVVRGWLRAPEGARGVLAAPRNWLAAIWHWLALFYLAAIWLVWAFAVPAGYERPTRVVLAIFMVALLARLASTAGVGAVERLRRRAPDLAVRHPGIDARIAFYHPFLLVAIRLLVALAAILLLAQLLGFGAITWLAGNPVGQQLSGSVSTLAVTVLLALAVWELVNAAIERRVARLTQAGQMARTARLRTLLPILRTGLLVSLVTVAGMMVLSQIGVNTAPLLASAGIIGVAIGFGSQKLVQDLITGLFLLMENTIQVGDVVSLAGLAGVVEDLSVRTIRLRSEDGSVHVIPFSSVTTVTNMTRDYSRAVIVAGVGYGEDYDRVVEVLRGIAAEMRADPAWQDIILGDLEVWGLDQFGDSAVMIKCRIMCTPFGRWSVAREFNRRMKARFDELGIEIPFPYRRLVIDQPFVVQGGAPLPPAAPPPT